MMNIVTELHNIFTIKKRISNKELKILLQNLYNKYGIRAVAKAVDINRYGFITKAVKIPTDKGRLNGLEIIQQ